VKAYATPNFELNFKKDWIHFLPVAIEFIWSNFIKTQNFYWDGTRESLSWLGYWGYVVWMQWPTQYIISAALIIFYTSKSEKLLNKINHESYSIITENSKWIKRVLKVMKIYSVLIIADVLIDFLFFDYSFNRSYHFILFAGMALISYWLGVEGFNKKNTSIIKLKTVLDKKDKQQLETLSEKLKLLMQQEKAFKNPNITLASLSKQLDVKSYLTTKCLSIIFEKNFNDFINEYRIEELKLLLKNPKNQNFTLLSLAFDVGFNSKASFNRTVKKLTGKSPKHLKSNI
jgi:AraC-like DNA-binding protein